MSKIFFCRHGNCWMPTGSQDGVSEQGKQELSRVLIKLKNLGFFPEISIATRAIRCIETAKILAPHIPTIICNELPCFCVHKNLQKQGDDFLAAIEPYLQEDKDAVMVSNDTMFTIMGLRLIEKRGGTVPWDALPDFLTWPDMGCGLLVEGMGYHYIEP